MKWLGLTSTTSIVLFFAVISMAACQEDEIHFDYVNKTQDTVTITIDSEEAYRIPAGETLKGGTFKRFLPDRIQAYDRAGRLLLDETFTEEKLKEVDYTIVIAEPSE